MRYVDATGLSSFNGSWDGQKLHFVVPVLNIMAEKYDPYELAENLPKELRRAQKESQELNSLLELLPYLSCEPPVIFGGTEPHLTCTATNAREMAEVIINWQAEKLRLGLHKNWDQARQNRAAEQAMAQVWTAKPLPFAGRVHADPDYHQATLLQDTDPDFTGATLSPRLPKLQSHRKLHQLQETDTNVDIQTESDEDNDELLKSEHIEEEVDQAIDESIITQPAVSVSPYEEKRQELEAFLEENKNLTIAGLIDMVAKHERLYWFRRTIEQMIIRGELDSLSPTNNTRYYAIYITEFYEAEYAHMRLDSTDPEFFEEDRERAQLLYEATYNYEKYISSGTKEKDQAYMDLIIAGLTDLRFAVTMSGYYQELVLATDIAERERILTDMSKDILECMKVNVPVSFESGKGSHNRGMYIHTFKIMELGGDFFLSDYFNNEDTLQELITEIVTVLAHECMHYFQYHEKNFNDIRYTDNDRPWQTWYPKDAVPFSINEEDYRAHPREAQAFYVKDTIKEMLEEQKVIELWISSPSNQFLLE